MIALLWFVLAVLVTPFKSKSRLEAEMNHRMIRSLPARIGSGMIACMGRRLACEEQRPSINSRVVS
jgi:hypothetical protein